MTSGIECAKATQFRLFSRLILPRLPLGALLRIQLSGHEMARLWGVLQALVPVESPIVV